MAAISIDDVTTTFTDGAGVFDVLMRSIDSHLDKQFISGRIKGSDYATVYLGALQTVLQQSIQFVLAEQKAEAEITLLESQNASILAETTIKNNQSAKDLLLKQEQIDASAANTVLKQSLNTAQLAVLAEQAAQFDTDFKYKVSKMLLDLRTTGITQGLLGITADAGETITKDMLGEAGLVVPAGDVLAAVV